VDRLAADPITLTAGAGGIAVLFRYGAVVLFDVAPLEEDEFLRQLRPLVQQPYAAPEIESLEIRIDASRPGGDRSRDDGRGRLFPGAAAVGGRRAQQEHGAGDVRGQGHGQFRPHRALSPGT
jgi:hypothetical protein